MVFEFVIPTPLPAQVKASAVRQPPVWGTIGNHFFEFFRSHILYLINSCIKFGADARRRKLQLYCFTARLSQRSRCAKIDAPLVKINKNIFKSNINRWLISNILHSLYLFL